MRFTDSVTFTLRYRDTLPEESEFQLEAAEAGARPPSVMTECPPAAVPQSASIVPHRRRASIAARPAVPARPTTIDRMKSSGPVGRPALIIIRISILPPPGSFAAVEFLSPLS